MHTCPYACHSSDHDLSRRGFLASAALGAFGVLGVGPLARVGAAGDLAKSGKRVLVIFLTGGVSQLETWDPKPGTDTGGPFRAIPTSVPGTHICELLPHTAKQMHRLALVRGINTAEDEHGERRTIMLTGRRPEPAHRVPARRRRDGRCCSAPTTSLAGTHAHHPRRRQRVRQAGRDVPRPEVRVGVARRRQAARRPAPPAGLTAAADRGREALRKKLNDRFAKSRRSAATDAYTESFDQAERVSKRADVSTSRARTAKVADRYGRHDFGRHLLLARRLLEAGVTYVKVSHSNYDTHHENFDFHIEQLGEFDRPFAALLDDLADRGMLDSDAGRGDERVRPHAEDQRPLRPRPLVEGVVGGAGRVRDQGRGGRRQDERQRHGRHRPRGERRPPVPHLLAGRSASTRRRTSTRTTGPVPIADPKADRDQRGARVIHVPYYPPDPTKVELDRPLKHAQPAHRLPVRPVRPVPVRQCPGQHAPTVRPADRSEDRIRRARELGPRHGVRPASGRR